MKSGLMLFIAVLATSSATSGQTGPTDLAGLEAKVQTAQTALARVEPTPRQRELRDLEDELAYLRVKARRGDGTTSRERRDLGDKLDRYTAQLNLKRPDVTPDHANGRNSGQGSATRSIPSATELDVRLQTSLSSKDATVEDRVEATTLVDLYLADDLLVPAGSLMVGHVTAVDKATRTDRKGSLTVAFTRLTIQGRTRDIRASVVQALESDGIKDEVVRVGAGAGVGAIIGGILGGAKGALAGVLIGGGGVLIATEGKDVEIPSGTVLRVRFDSNVQLTE